MVFMQDYTTPTVINGGIGSCKLSSNCDNSNNTVTNGQHHIDDENSTWMLISGESLSKERRFFKQLLIDRSFASVDRDGARF